MADSAVTEKTAPDSAPAIMPPNSGGKIRWQDALATNVMLVDFHLSHVRKMLQLDQVRKDRASFSSKDNGQLNRLTFGLTERAFFHFRR